MSNVVRGQFVAGDRLQDADEQLARTRQNVVDGIHRSLDDAASAGLLPDLIQEAIRNKIWEHPRRTDYFMAEPMPFDQFVRAPYPRGLGTSIDAIRRLIVGSEAALLAFDAATQRPNGNPTGTNQHGGNFDNIQGSSEQAPTGTSAQAGIRRLRKAADAGDGNARELLAQVIDHTSDMSIHRACKQMGWRKDTPPLKAVQAAWRRADQEQREEIAAWVDDQMSPVRNSRFG